MTKATQWGKLVVKPAKLGRATSEEFFRIVKTVNFIPEDNLISKGRLEDMLAKKSFSVRGNVYYLDVEILYG
jgi:hypothetical protein|tara:strand:+ start:581 stop:796 length:216 start_codon:yes stop_codon:yes gene_type:complete